MPTRKIRNVNEGSTFIMSEIQFNEVVLNLTSMKVDPELTSLFSLGGTTSKMFSHLRTTSEYCKGENEISV